MRSDELKAGRVAQWVLQCNPERWRIHDFFASGQELGYWSITRYASEVASGDRFALWVSGKNAGVVGLGEVVGSPTEEDPGDAADGVQWAVALGRGQRRWLLPITLTSNFVDDAVPKAELAADPQFADSAIIRQPVPGDRHGMGSPAPTRRGSRRNTLRSRAADIARCPRLRKPAGGQAGGTRRGVRSGR
ncbi:EVE domain-containing protein [Micromonospora sp. LOL_015]|uniref:EVE domain-containing protein n=1 Tax=Micromonospora sp. LOL_015 TaxID=3345416 RepID=UPI003A875BF1